MMNTTMIDQIEDCAAVTVRDSTWSCFAMMERFILFSHIQPDTAINMLESPPDTHESVDASTRAGDENHTNL